MIIFFVFLPPWCSADCSGVSVCDWWWRDHAGGRAPRCPSGKGQGRGRSSAALLLRAGQIQVPRGQSNPLDPWWSAGAQGFPEVPHHNQAGKKQATKADSLYLCVLIAYCCYCFTQNVVNLIFSWCFTVVVPCKPKHWLPSLQGILLVRFRAEDLKSRLSELGLGGDIQSPLSTSSSNHLPVRLDQTAIHQLYLTTDLMQGVLPNATIIQDWQPFKPLPSNMAILMKKDIDWMVDDLSNPAVASLCTFPFRVPIGDDW